MHMTGHRACKWHVVLALLACIGGACGTSGDDRVAADSVPSAVAPDTAESLAAARDESPLAVYPGFGRTRDPDRAQYRRQEIAKEQYVAHYMQQAGFQYTRTPSVVNPPPRPPSMRQGPNER